MRTFYLKHFRTGLIKLDYKEVYCQQEIAFCKNGKVHNEFGPAGYSALFKKQYYSLNDVEYENVSSNEYWIKYQKLIAFE